MVMKEELGDHVHDWANIGDPLSLIADLTHSVKDRIRMSAVCRSWQAVDIKMNKRIKSPLCLMLAETEKSGKCCFYNISEEVFVELDLPQVRGRRCLGTPFGWLVTCSLDLEIQLFDPLSRAILPLPSTRTFTRPPKVLPDLLRMGGGGFILPHDYPQMLCKYLVHKFILSSNPADSDCIVVALYCYGLLAFARPGSKAWTPIDDIGISGVVDLIYFKGSFYACKQRGELFLCVLHGSHPRALKFAPRPRVPPYDNKYLFELGGHICLAYRGVVRYRIGEDGKCMREHVDMRDGDVGELAMRRRYSSLEFMIFKLNMHTRTWEKIYSLGDSSLFLGNCSTFVVTAADYPGCRPNCIYFTDDSPYHRVHDSTKGRGIDMGIYNCQNLKLALGDKEFDPDDIVEPFPKFRPVPPLVKHTSLSPPLWIIPYLK